MITKLTKKQEEQIPKYIDKYISLASKKTDRKKSTKAVQDLYENIGEEKPIVIFGKSPLSTAIMVAMTRILSDNKLAKDNNQLDNQLGNQLANKLHHQLHNKLYSQLGNQLGNQLYNKLHNKLYNQLCNKFYSQLGNQLYDQLDNQLDNQLSKINNDWHFSIRWLVWAGWYDYAKYIGVKFDKKSFNLFVNFVKNISFIMPYKGIVFVSENPTEIHWNDRGLLHNTRDMAIRYADGYGVYSVNGIRFEPEFGKKLVEGKANFTEIIGLKDVDQRNVAMLLTGDNEKDKFLKHIYGNTTI